MEGQEEGVDLLQKDESGQKSSESDPPRSLAKSSVPKPFDASLFGSLPDSPEDPFQTPTGDFASSSNKDLFTSFSDSKQDDSVSPAGTLGHRNMIDMSDENLIKSVSEQENTFSTPPQSLDPLPAIDSISLGDEVLIGSSDWSDEQAVEAIEQNSSDPSDTQDTKNLLTSSEKVPFPHEEGTVMHPFQELKDTPIHSTTKETKRTLAQLAEQTSSPLPIYSPPPSNAPSSNVSFTTVPSSLQSSGPFCQSLPYETDDPFVAAIATSESDRRRDAWIPSDSTRRALIMRQTNIHGSEFVNRAEMTMPGIVFEETQLDPLKELLYKHQGDGEASRRNVLTIDQVTRDIDGLRKLLDAGCLRSAVQLTSLLLTSVGQGRGQTFMPSQNTAESLQIWFTRIALLVKLHQFSIADQECQAFGMLDKPDMFYEYYPDLYPGRKGSVVPFGFRVLVAEIAQYTSQHQESLTKLYQILSVCQWIVSNLSTGLDEYGDKVELSEEYRKASLSLWTTREIRVQYSIGNCLLSMKDYHQAVKTFENIAEKDTASKPRVLSAIGRVFLQLGDLKSAGKVFGRIEILTADSPEHQIQVLMNRGFLRMAQNTYSDAHKQFSDILKIDPNNFTAINNTCVCLLYMGQLKNALNMLESLVHNDPATYLDESILFNLCTLYELESSRSASKKQNLLFLASKHRGDGFNVNCLKMA